MAGFMMFREENYRCHDDGNKTPEEIEEALINEFKYLSPFKKLPWYEKAEKKFDLKNFNPETTKKQIDDLQKDKELLEAEVSMQRAKIRDLEASTGDKKQMDDLQADNENLHAQLLEKQQQLEEILEVQGKFKECFKVIDTELEKRWVDVYGERFPIRKGLEAVKPPQLIRSNSAKLEEKVEPENVSHPSSQPNHNENKASTKSKPSQANTSAETEKVFQKDDNKPQSSTPQSAQPETQKQTGNPQSSTSNTNTTPSISQPIEKVVLLTAKKEPTDFTNALTPIESTATPKATPTQATAKPPQTQAKPTTQTTQATATQAKDDKKTTVCST